MNFIEAVNHIDKGIRKPTWLPGYHLIIRDNKLVCINRQGIVSDFYHDLSGDNWEVYLFPYKEEEEEAEDFETVLKANKKLLEKNKILKNLSREISEKISELITQSIEDLLDIDEDDEE